MNQYFLYIQPEKLRSIGVSDIDEMDPHRDFMLENDLTPMVSAYITIEQCTSLIPHGVYCYGKNGNCPFYDKFPQMPHQGNGYCHFLNRGDWQMETSGLLWDSCKECGINLNDMNKQKEKQLLVEVTPPGEEIDAISTQQTESQTKQKNDADAISETP